MDRILEQITAGDQKPIIVLRGKTSFRRRRAMIEAISESKLSFVTNKNFITDSKRCYHNPPEVINADYVIIKDVFHARQLKKLSVSSMKSLVHGEYYDENYQSIGCKKLVIITDEMAFEKFFDDDRALLARIKFIDI